MYVRCGYFEGTVAEADRERFVRHVEREVMPLLRQMPGLREARLFWRREFQDGAPPYLLVMQHGYDDRAALEAALASPARERLRAKLAEIMPLFRGRIVHVNYDLADPA